MTGHVSADLSPDGILHSSEPRRPGPGPHRAGRPALPGARWSHRGAMRKAGGGGGGCGGGDKSRGAMHSIAVSVRLRPCAPGEPTAVQVATADRAVISRRAAPLYQGC